MKLTPKLTLIFVLFSAALLSIVNFLGYNVGRTMLEAAAVAELESTAGEKEAALIAWIEEKQAHIKALAENPVTVEEASVLKTNSLDSLAATITHNRLVRQFQLRVSAGDFLSVMLLDLKSGKILVSTNPKELDMLKDTRSYFLHGRQGTYLTPVYFSPELQAPAITASTPIISEDGQLLGVLAARIDLDELNAIIQRRSGMHQTDEAFLVNTSHQPVTQPRFLTEPAVLQRGIYTVPVNRCLERTSGSVFANDYHDVPVIAVYRWLPEYQICMIVKISQAEALAQEQVFATISVLIGLAALLVASLIAVGLSHTLLAPIRAMQTATQRYGGGDLTVRLPETRNDELGLLALEFNAMATALAEKEDQLRRYSHELENRVAERTAELGQSEERFRLLTETSPNALLMVGGNGKISFANQMAVTIFGYSREELVGQTLEVLVPERFRAGHSVLSKNFFADPKPRFTGAGRELFARRKDGSELPVEIGLSPVQTPDGLFILATITNITERKQAENAIREKERLLSESQRIGQVGSFSLDIINNAFQFSDEMYYLFDVSPENFHHNLNDFLALIYPSDRSNVANRITDLRAGLQIKELDFRIFRQNGELRHLRCKGAVEFNSDGQPTHFIGTMQDITAQRIAEIQINQQIKRLTALSEIDRAIISGLDQQHTLGVILSAILSQLQVDAADILLLDSDGQTLQYAAGQGFHTQTVKEIQVHLGEGHSGRAARERRMIRISNVIEEAHDPMFNVLVTTEKFASYIAVPLIVKREVKGVLEVFHRTFFQPYQEWLDFLNTLAGQTAIALENATLLGNLQTSNQELAQAYDATLEGWSHAMDLRDKETEGHTQRVTELTLKVARAIGMSESQLVQIRRGALLHDIGKLGIPDHILFKPDKLTPEEWEIMQKHPEYAHEMLSSIQYLKPALPIPYFHHEKWDGSGYPLGLRGEQIPLEARIFSVVDVWDALLSDRPYRKAWTVERTLEYIQALAGSHFDPSVVDYFMKIMKT